MRCPHPRGVVTRLYVTARSGANSSNRFGLYPRANDRQNADMGTWRGGIEFPERTIGKSSKAVENSHDFFSAGKHR